MAHDCLGRAIDAVLWGMHNREKDPDPTWRYEAHWIYQRADGAEHFAVVRFRKSRREKVYRPIHKDQGRWIVGDPPGPLPLYRLPGVDGSPRVYLAEGEKVCDLARSLGLVATASATGERRLENRCLSRFLGRPAIAPE